ncbi:MAG: hypothetical protein HOM68_17405 [Gemmatimonadetes bacterium]|jgi:hypothetical protein|nr:hypothetical protein [Gemmatimonadota bacterium]MBT5141464.1 hypothetical protein [Gemmatimonadota bacterium]MBT5590697.1 hypothetical protein [Gemmatimonadota bacterium]MBT5965168.1 hypothetical protein [Gemmatimonadota bacterium]MBT6625847.1 hypothetical protein [Gemmatimonadota bacterium]
MTQTTHQHKQDISTPTQVVQIDVGGSVDGVMTRDPIGYGPYDQTWENMVGVSLENVGDEAVIDPWISVDGRCRWRSLEEILAGILTPQMNDAAKARAIWEFARTHRYHSTTGDDEVKDTVKMLNVYGYTLCWDEAYTVSNLWQAAGLKIRRGLPHGHCTTEVYYDDDYHLLDSDEHLLILDRDNQTIASEAQISRDHDLMKRAHTYGILSGESRETSESAASLFCHQGPRSGGRPRVGDHTMSLVLRPGEKLAWGWTENGKYHGFGQAPPRYANGKQHWSVPLTDTRWALSTNNVLVEETGLAAQAEGQIIFEMRSPYVVVGGRMQIELEGSGALSAQRVEDDSWTPIEPSAEPGAEGTTIDLDPLLPAAAVPCYGVRVRVQGNSWVLRKLQIEADLQMAPLSLPTLRLGSNQVTYTDCSEARHMRLRCQWLERNDWTAPPMVEGLAPNAGKPQLTSCVRLGWNPTPEAMDYHVRLGTDEDVDLALSPVFDKLVSRTTSAGQCFWTVPEEGLLNPDTDYYWKVRARSAQGVWGPWSQAAHLRVLAPGIPLQVHLEMNWPERCGRLHWRPNPQGNEPLAYEIHGSDERGFSARRGDYEIYLGNQGGSERQTVPGNLVAVVDADADARGDSDSGSLGHMVIGPQVDLHMQHPFYRVVAVDADGVRSGPSQMVEAPHPFVTTPLPRQIPANEATIIQLHSLRSRGDLRAVSDGPRRYRQAFRDGEQLEFLLDEGPDWIHLDATTGVLTMSPPVQGALGNHTVTLRIRSNQGDADVIGWDVDVQPVSPATEDAI